MYEKGKIRRDASIPGDSAAILRELHWAELVSQLAATRELRAEAKRKPDELQIIGRFRSLSTGLADAPHTSQVPASGPPGSAASEHHTNSEHRKNKDNQRDAS
ncbi:hypothetical protein [Porphyrobacter sp. GA68]|uniref:hypothetical protein n=1 Tax=Porphyrobacter sp. GA68 TaxID=2883480 RepID=UPI001D17D75A|nr:hypothetical protein [Porphyrobacter sp. GA68]